MSYALQEINIPVLVVNDGSDLTFTNPTMTSDIWTTQDPAYLRMQNATNADYQVTMMTAGDSFWLRSGDSILFPLAPNERGFFYVCKFINSSSVATPMFFLCTYFSNRDAIFQLEENSQAPPALPTPAYTPVKSGLAQTSGGTTEWGIPTRELAVGVSTTNLNANQVRYVYMRVEYAITLTAHQFEVTSTPASNANVRIGIYRADGTLQPTGAPLYDSGNIAVASGFTGIKTTTGISVALVAAMYLVCINIDVNMGMRAANVGSLTIDNNMGANEIVQKVVATQTYGAFPNPGDKWTTTNTGSAGMQHSIIWQWTE